MKENLQSTVFVVVSGGVPATVGWMSMNLSNICSRFTLESRPTRSRSFSLFSSLSYLVRLFCVPALVFCTFPQCSEMAKIFSIVSHPCSADRDRTVRMRCCLNLMCLSPRHSGRFFFPRLHPMCLCVCQARGTRVARRRSRHVGSQVTLLNYITTHMVLAVSHCPP